MQVFICMPISFKHNRPCIASTFFTYTHDNMIFIITKSCTKWRIFRAELKQLKFKISGGTTHGPLDRRGSDSLAATTSGQHSAWPKLSWFCFDPPMHGPPNEMSGPPCGLPTCKFLEPPLTLASMSLAWSSLDVRAERICVRFRLKVSYGKLAANRR